MQTYTPDEIRRVLRTADEHRNVHLWYLALSGLRRRTLPLDEGLVSVLKRASACYAQEKLALGAAHADSCFVGCNEAGEPYTPGALTNMWRRLTKAAGVTLGQAVTPGS
jgi:hypothetical protein